MRYRRTGADRGAGASLTGPVGPVGLIATVLLLAISIGYGASLIARVWQVDANGVSAADGSVPYWDFANLWAGARLATTGRMALLFDTPAFQHALPALFHAPVTGGEWCYPPTMLLLGLPFAQLPIQLAYAVWTLGAIALYALAVRGLGLPPLHQALAVLSPALMWNVALGQNGALVGALLLGGLIQAERRPLLGGMLLGCLVIKPHLAVLVPVALLARRNWRALAAMAATAIGLALLSGLVLGWEAWIGFVTRTEPWMRTVLEMPLSQGRQVRAITVFVLTRALGAGVATGYLVQLAVTASAAAATAWVWARPNDPLFRIVVTMVLVGLATPYAHSYDLTMLGGPLALLMHRAAREDRLDPAAIAVWLMPCMPMLHLPHLVLPVAAIALAILATRLLTPPAAVPVPVRIEALA